MDIGLLYELAPASTLRDQPFLAAAKLESCLGRKVDLVVMNSAPVDLGHRILRDGVLLFQHNPSARIAFEVHARNEYWDLLPFSNVTVAGEMPRERPSCCGPLSLLTW